MTSLNLYYLLKVLSLNTATLGVRASTESQGSPIQSTAPDKGTLLSDKVRWWSPTSLAPGTGFVEHNFSTDPEGWFWGDSSTLHYRALHYFYYCYTVMYIQ